MRTKRRGAPEVSRTGARFPRPVLDVPEADDDPVLSELAAVDVPRQDRGMVGTTGARFRRGGPAEPPPTVGPLPESRAAVVASTSTSPPVEPPPAAAGPDLDPPPDVAPVRPYVLTRGRTRSAVALPLEALLTAGPAAARPAGSAQALVQLCRVPRSVAEVAALTGLPLGVTRVLVGDLAATGALVVQRTVGADGPDLALLGRVLTGLRNL